MSQSLTRRQAAILGIVVLLAVGLMAIGLFTIGRKQGFWADTSEVSVRFAETHDLAPGTPVRIRGVDAGQVVAIEYPDHDGPDAAVTVRMKIEAKYSDRLFADATAQVYSTGLLGSKVVAIQPGTPSSGPLQTGQLTARESPDLTQAAAKIGTAADEVSRLVSDTRNGNGTLGKLIRDDKLYTEMTDLARDSRQMVKRAGDAVGTVEKKADDVEQFVQDGRATLKSVKQGTDAIQSLPIIRNYVTDATKLLIRPECRKQVMPYKSVDLFEPDTAILTEEGREHLVRLADLLRKVKGDKAEVVVTATCERKFTGQTVETATELTRKQAQVVVEKLKEFKGLKAGWFSSRKATPIGLGFESPPITADEPVPPSHVLVVVFLPQ
jgi:hypothetical protein